MKIHKYTPGKPWGYETASQRMTKYTKNPETRRILEELAKKGEAGVDPNTHYGKGTGARGYHLAQQIASDIQKLGGNARARIEGDVIYVNNAARKCLERVLAG